MSAPNSEQNPEDDPEQEREPSRSALRQTAEAYAALAEQLAKGKHGKLPDPPFDEALREAILDSQRFTKNARTRQIRRVAQLLRELGPLADIVAALEGRTPEARAKQAREQLAEAWRARLLAERDAALAEFMAEHPDADRQQLRQWIRQASRTPPDARSKRAATSLLRAIRGSLERAPDQPDESTLPTRATPSSTASPDSAA